MKSVFLVKVGDSVRPFYSEADMAAAGFKTANKTVTEEEFNSNGCYARIVDGDIVVGKTAREREEEEIGERIAEIDGRLAALDAKYLTPRVLSGIGAGDAFALEQKEKHDAEAAPLRAERIAAAAPPKKWRQE